MITQLNIKNFKSHGNTSLSLSCLNILTGLNGVGKSSVFQALLLLRQSYLKNRLHEGIDLNKPLCNIGLVGDISIKRPIPFPYSFPMYVLRLRFLVWSVAQCFFANFGLLHCA